MCVGVYDCVCVCVCVCACYRQMLIIRRIVMMTRSFQGMYNTHTRTHTHNTHTHTHTHTHTKNTPKITKTINNLYYCIVTISHSTHVLYICIYVCIQLCKQSICMYVCVCVCVCVYISSCRVCLMDFESGENVRTLPCFHPFHTACIDKVLFCVYVCVCVCVCVCACVVMGCVLFYVRVNSLCMCVYAFFN